MHLMFAELLVMPAVPCGRAGTAASENGVGIFPKWKFSLGDIGG